MQQGYKLISQLGQVAGVFSGTPSFIILAPKDNVDVDALVELQMPYGERRLFR
jgi:hypothetical protein